MSSVLESVLGFGPSNASTPLPPEIIENAAAICRSSAMKSDLQNTNPEIPVGLPDIVWGKYYNEKVDRLTALPYRLIVEESYAKTGFVILCESTNI